MGNLGTGRNGSALVFPGPDALLAAFDRLVAASGGRWRRFLYGKSRKGRALWGVEAGEGEVVLLAYGFPQPDEPLGGVVLLRFAERLIEEPWRLEGIRWVLVPCVDPDGAEENEEWFGRPVELERYLWRHFRPAEGEQVEWSFPVAVAGGGWSGGLPETEALAACIERYRPLWLVSWHNALLGGAYVLLRGQAEPLGDRLREAWIARGLPTHRGMPELEFAEELGPGVYRLPLFGEIVGALRAGGIGDPADLLGCGAPGYEFALHRGAKGVVVPELPLFIVEGIDDEGPAPCTRRELLHRRWCAEEEAFARWSRFYERARGLLVQEDARVRALEAYNRFQREMLVLGHESLLGTAEERPARRAEVVDVERVAAFERLLPFGVLWQALGSVRSPEAEALRLALEGELEAMLEAVLGVDVRPAGEEVVTTGVEMLTVLAEAAKGPI